MVKVLFRRPCHIPPCLINGEGGSNIMLHGTDKNLKISLVLLSLEQPSIFIGSFSAFRSTTICRPGLALPRGSSPSSSVSISYSRVQCALSRAEAETECDQWWRRSYGPFRANYALPSLIDGASIKEKNNIAATKHVYLLKNDPQNCYSYILLARGLNKK